MTRLIVFLLAAYGLTNAIALLKIGTPIRCLARWLPPRYLWKDESGKEDDEIRSLWLDLVECHACCGFWIGAILSWILISPAIDWIDAGTWPLMEVKMRAAFVDGLISSAGCFIINKLMRELPDAVIEYLD